MTKLLLMETRLFVDFGPANAKRVGPYPAGVSAVPMVNVPVPSGPEITFEPELIELAPIPSEPAANCTPPADVFNAISVTLLRVV